MDESDHKWESRFSLANNVGIFFQITDPSSLANYDYEQDVLEDAYYTIRYICGDDQLYHDVRYLCFNDRRGVVDMPCPTKLTEDGGSDPWTDVKSNLYKNIEHVYDLAKPYIATKWSEL